MTRAAALTLLLLALAVAPRAQQPNVVLITVDDLNTAVGYLSEEPGNPLQTLFPDPEMRARMRAVLTPNLDRLAAEGVPFTNAYTASPICAPSRASFMTGVRPHTSNYNDNGDGHFRDNEVLGSVSTLPEYLKANGYYTAGVGKIFHKWSVDLNADGEIVLDGPDSQRSWDVWVNRSVGTNGSVTPGPWSTEDALLRMGVTDAPFEGFPDVVNSDFIAEVLRTGTATIEDRVYEVDVTVSPPDGQPFFLALGIYRPHTPLYVSQDLLDLFPSDSLEALTDALRTEYFDDTADLSEGGMQDVFRVGDEITGGPAFALYEQAEAIDPVNGPVLAWRDAVRYYLAAVALADRAIGRVLDALDEGPYADNTVVVLLGDHGWHLGEKTWFGKTTLWEESASTPFIIRAPGAVSPGVVRRQPVSLMDLYPTVVGLAGLPVPEHVEGEDLAPLLAAVDAEPISVAITSMNRLDHTLRTPRFRLVNFDFPSRRSLELYDVVGDPEERINLIDDPAYRRMRDSLYQVLDFRLRGTPPIDTNGPPPPIPGLELRDPRPNPSLTGVTLDLVLPIRATVRWEVVDALGRRVWHERLGTQPPGTLELRWQGRAAPGIYTARVTVNGTPVGARRLVLTR
ncbi:MAG: sulfatase [Bacteroidota bacterium]